MKRSLPTQSTIVGLCLAAVALALGCPMYSDGRSGGCFYATDCPLGFRCTNDGRCVESPPHIGTGGQAGDAGGQDARADATVDGTTVDSTTVDGTTVDRPAPDDVTTDRAMTDVARTDGPLVDAGVDARPSPDGTGAVHCGNPNDCSAAETCSTDGTCQAGNCSVHPCINQFQCANTTSGPACVHGDSRACGADSHCLVSQRCIDGLCTSVTDLCTDRSQCSASQLCVEGRCATSCTADPQCPQGFTCRLALGVCNVKAKTCVRTSDCGSKDSVCVDGACVPRCSVSGACEGGTGICVDNGCVPTAKVVVECDGQGTLAGCPAGSVCLHRNCYVSCESPNSTACASQPSTPVCRTITVGSTSYSVCGTTATLGSECDPTANRVCAVDRTCVDGYCR